MKGKEHNKRGIQFGINVKVVKMVNKDKDAPSQKYPGCPHHAYNHGIGTNTKYFRIGRGGVIMSVIHNIDDRRTRKCPRSILYERIKSYKPGKIINNLTQTGEWWK